MDDKKTMTKNKLGKIISSKYKKKVDEKFLRNPISKHKKIFIIIYL